MDYRATGDLEQQTYSKSLLVVNAQNLLEDATANVENTKELINLSYISGKWLEVDQAVHKFLENLSSIQQETLQMISWTVQGNNNALSTSDLQLLDSKYQTSVKHIMKLANEVPAAQMFMIMNLKGDKTEGRFDIHSLLPIVTPLAGTDLLTTGNAGNANNALNLVIEQLAKAQQDQKNNLATIDLERKKNLQAWENQNQKLLTSLQDLSQYIVTSSYMLTQNLK